jgi:hypothetical protein
LKNASLAYVDASPFKRPVRPPRANARRFDQLETPARLVDRCAHRTAPASTSGGLAESSSPGAAPRPYGCGSTPHRLSFSRVIPVKIRVPATFRASYTANSRSGVGIVLATFACPGSQLGRRAPGTGALRRLPARLPADLRARSGQGVAPLHSAGAITSRLLPQPCRQPDSCRCSGRSRRAAKR